MPFVSMASAKNKIDGSIKNRVLDFLQKLQLDDTTPGLHIEPMVNPRDKRVRTGRVTDEWRAVLFRMDVDGGPHYVYYGTWHHDEAIKVARSTVLKLNLSLGAPEFEDQGMPDVAEAPSPDRTPVEAGASLEEAGEAKAPEDEGRGTAGDAAPAPGTGGTDEASRAPAGSAAVEPWENQLPGRWTPDRLHAEAGIQAAAAAAALAARTRADLNAIIDGLPEAQGLVLLGLANGEDLSAIREELGLAGPVDEGLPEDERLDRALRDAPVGFAFVGDNPQELREAFESLDIDRWRVFLHPEQRKYVSGRWKGSYRLSGGAGTGKTVVLVHRARDLVREDPRTRVLLTTFTRTLAGSLAQQVKRLDADLPQVSIGETGLSIAGIDQVAAKVIAMATAGELDAAQAAVLGPGRNTVTRRIGKTQAEFRTAVEISDPDLSGPLVEPTFLEQEYISVVLAHRITDEKGYLRAPRQGRGTALNRAARKEIWKVFAQCRRSHQMTDTVTFPELAAIAAAVLEARAARGDALPFDHVLVDEAQDFHAAHWLLLRALVPERPDDLFIAEDSHQRIYGQKIPLSRFGIQIRGRSRRLRLNYRTTAENLAYAITLLEGGDYTDIEDEAESTKDYRSVRSGPAPVVQRAQGPADEADAAAAQVRRWVDAGVPHEAVAVLVRTDQHAKRAAAALDAQAVANASVGRGETAGKGKVSVMTMHSAKGMEFERVVVMGVDPSSVATVFGHDRLPDAERHDALLRERSLLYVAATRARDELVVTSQTGR
jgi:superfamily I DNA/RNA helicase